MPARWGPWGPDGWVNPQAFYDTQPATHTAFCGRCPVGATPADCMHKHYLHRAGAAEYAKVVDAYDRVPPADRRRPCGAQDPQPYTTRRANAFCRRHGMPGASVRANAGWLAGRVPDDVVAAAYALPDLDQHATC